jgi:predicted oxidoreductase
MRLNGLSEKDAEAFIKKALEMGANFFEHADIYGGGTCESLFSRAIGMNPTIREKLLIQSKCGIVPGKYYDFSKEHILSSVEGSLKRLGTDYLDLLLLHRPDILMEPEEVAEAFSILRESGKVRFFGVSNQKPSQIELLKKYVKEPLVANQLQLSIMHCAMMSQGIHVNMSDEAATERDGSVLDYCRLQDITIQCWSPFQYGFFEGAFLDNPQFPELNQVIDRIAANHGVSNTTIAVAWLLRHPAHFQVVTGTMKTGRLSDCIKAGDITLSREEWYQIYLAAGNTLP